MNAWAVMPFVDCWELTRDAISTLIAQKLASSLETGPQTIRILAIDNGSAEPDRWREIDNGYPYLFRWRHAPPLPSLAATWNVALDFVWTTGADRCLVVNNDVQLHVDTYRMLSVAMDEVGAFFITGVGVKPDQFDPSAKISWDTSSRGGPDFSCYLISRECHELYRFDENFAPAYFEDNDFHRRLKLDGHGDRIFGIPVPFLHHGSATINRNEKVKAEWGPKFDRCREYYVKKWGGVPGEEKFQVPFGGEG